MSEFWYMTPNEFNLYVEAYGEKIQHEEEVQTTLVWLCERLRRSETLPSLNELLGKQDQGMTDDQMLEMVRKLNVQFGGDIKTEPIKDGE